MYYTCSRKVRMLTYNISTKCLYILKYKKNTSKFQQQKGKGEFEFDNNTAYNSTKVPNNNKNI